MRRTGALAYALILVAFLAVASGCGAAEDAEEDSGPFFTAAQVQERFHASTGNSKLLRRTEVPDEAWVQLGPGLNPSPEIQTRYGTFVVYVVKQGRERAVGSLMRGRPDESSSSPGADLLWELDTLSDTWVANKRYGANVVLAWFSAKKSPEVDARFERLDRILAGLTG